MNNERALVFVIMSVVVGFIMLLAGGALFAYSSAYFARSIQNQELDCSCGDHCDCNLPNHRHGRATGDVLP